jgi:glycosyltransferase involved in cell wall biosynthesis
VRDLTAATGLAPEATGYYVPPADPEALRRAIIHLLDSPDTRRQLGGAGRRAVERLMGVDHFAVRVAEMVNGVLPGDYSPPLLHHQQVVSLRN